MNKTQNAKYEANIEQIKGKSGALINKMNNNRDHF